MEKVLKSKDFYKEKIIEMVKGMDNQEILNYLFVVVCDIMEEISQKGC